MRLAAECAAPASKNHNKCLRFARNTSVIPPNEALRSGLGSNPRDQRTRSTNNAVYEVGERMLGRTRTVFWTDMIAEDAEAAEQTRKEHLSCLISSRTDGRMRLNESSAPTFAPPKNTSSKS